MQGCNDGRNHKRSCELYDFTHPEKRREFLNQTSWPALVCEENSGESANSGV